MGGYSAACGDKPWFFELDLIPVLCIAVWEIVRHSPVKPIANYPELEQVVASAYEDVMDGRLLEKAMWDCAHETFTDLQVCNKIYKALQNGHEPAVSEASN